MPNLRRHLLTLVLASATALSGCGRLEHAGLPPDVRQELEAGRSTLNGWIAASRSGIVPEDEAVIALGYAERLRLGLGSPFRLVDMVLRDPRLSDETRHELAWALLSRTYTGDTYEVDAVTLDRAGLGHITSWPGLGAHHLRIIENAISESRDPRGGELAVRLAYQLAAMEGSLPSAAPRFASRVAALVRDRELARADAARLLRSAEVAQGDPLRAIARWRSERWFRVEQPPMTALPPEVEREALELAPRLAQALRLLTPRLADITTASRPTVPDVRPSLLTPGVAVRLGQLSDSLNMPPQAPVSIGARTYRQEMEQAAWLDEEERARRAAVVQARDEERFVAAYGQLERRSPFDAAPSLTAVRVAVTLRPYAQESVWFPGFGGPTARELEERFGFAYVRFADDVAPEWRPYYRLMLEGAVRDMQRVLPALDLRGLGVRFAAARSGETTLAMHDPRVRELVLPPGSSAGTIAHEIAHDLDWQVALRRYRVRGDYASDRAVRLTNDRFAARVLSLGQEAAMESFGSDLLHAHAQRPAENFARAVDWFVAASLASQGRMNGYLSSVQDDVLTGYGTVRPPDITGRAGDAIINIFDDVAPLYPETRDWFLRSYGTGRDMTAFDLLRTILEIQLPQSTDPRGSVAASHARAVDPVFTAITSARAGAFGFIDDWMCRAPGGAYDTRLEQARRSLVVEGAAARARGVAIQRARLLSGDAGVRWVARRFFGVPWPNQELDEPVEETLEELVQQAADVASVEVRRPSQGFELLSLPVHCRGLAVAY
ncbi:MAG TPA: hypothetical protein VK929_16735 [Longimicrobiales bacterium]|nr:hypothetical protein [Longimicrobiales bacterium]